MRFQSKLGGVGGPSSSSSDKYRSLSIIGILFSKFLCHFGTVGNGLGSACPMNSSKYFGLHVIGFLVIGILSLPDFFMGSLTFAVILNFT